MPRVVIFRGAETLLLIERSAGDSQRMELE